MVRSIVHFWGRAPFEILSWFILACKYLVGQVIELENKILLRSLLRAQEINLIDLRRTYSPIY